MLTNFNKTVELYLILFNDVNYDVKLIICCTFSWVQSKGFQYRDDDGV